MRYWSAQYKDELWFWNTGFAYKFPWNYNNQWQAGKDSEVCVPPPWSGLSLAHWNHPERWFSFKPYKTNSGPNIMADSFLDAAFTAGGCSAEPRPGLETENGRTQTCNLLDRPIFTHREDGYFLDKSLIQFNFLQTIRVWKCYTVGGKAK